jgi:hypothetical protein
MGMAVIHLQLITMTPHSAMFGIPNERQGGGITGERVIHLTTDGKLVIKDSSEARSLRSQSSIGMRPPNRTPVRGVDTERMFVYIYSTNERIKLVYRAAGP